MNPIETIADAVGECFDAAELLSVIGEALENITRAYAMTPETKARIERVRGTVSTAEQMIEGAARKAEAAEMSLQSHGQLQ